ncbi:LacI family DNA-binding transcriptional regulator [Frondihabitans sp. PAMC 28766]|uniref:LacI family DNA-binding transcriptional regulator n=1 Tax=Frondihabitans sp. PAMC 28766 TaxID=1795630 RepID=UPI00138F4E0D|nr:LacI family DNA-binding transcriptional regulator [Frondihabitans sp. PAMC 28766]
MSKGGVTLRDVAERVGVTPAAVSMALLGRGRISEQKRLDIQNAAAELGYVGSSAARALRSQRADTIALIVPTTATHVFGHAYFTHVLQGVIEAANERNIQVLISTNADQDNGLTAYERVMRSNMVDGAIVTSAAIDDSTVERLNEGGVPVVLIGNFPYLQDPVTVGVDDRAASVLATDHLIGVHGRTRLLHVAGPLDHQTGLDRSIGFTSAVEAAGISSGSMIVEGDLSEGGGADAILRLGASVTDFDGIFFANDDMAYGAIQELRRQGVRVPADVSIIGFDDFGLSRAVSPSITTIHVPAEEMARAATGRLLDIVEGIAGWSRRDFEVSLVARESCGCGPLRVAAAAPAAGSSHHT